MKKVTPYLFATLAVILIAGLGSCMMMTTMMVSKFMI